MLEERKVLWETVKRWEQAEKLLAAEVDAGAVPG
jgi:hypothetical protein